MVRYGYNAPSRQVPLISLDLYRRCRILCLTVSFSFFLPLSRFVRHYCRLPPFAISTTTHVALFIIVQRANDDTKDWAIPITAGMDPYADHFAVKKMEKKARVLKNTEQQIKNQTRAAQKGKGKVVAPSLEAQALTGPAAGSSGRDRTMAFGKSGTRHRLGLAQRSTASMGKVGAATARPVITLHDYHTHSTPLACAPLKRICITTSQAVHTYHSYDPAFPLSEVHNGQLTCYALHHHTALIFPSTNSTTTWQRTRRFTTRKASGNSAFRRPAAALRRRTATWAFCTRFWARRAPVAVFSRTGVTERRGARARRRGTRRRRGSSRERGSAMRRAISELAFGESLGNGDCGRRAFNIPTHDGVLATVSDTNPFDVPYDLLPSTSRIAALLCTQPPCQTSQTLQTK